MARHIAAGIDIGTYQIKVVVAESVPGKDRSSPRIIGTGYAESKGLRHGYITNVQETAKSIRKAVSEAEKAAGIKITRAFLAIGGVGVSGNISIGAINTQGNDIEITEQDLKKVQDASEAELPQSFSQNRKILHTIPLQYKIDGKTVLGRPQGMKGTRFEVRTLFVTCLSHHLNDLVSALEEAGIEIDDVMASPIAASLVALSKTQKVAGCVLANIGSETVSIIVYENNIPISLEVFPIGSNDITNDIALGLKIPIEEAEAVKTGSSRAVEFPRKKLDEIIVARLSDIFDLIESHLKKINRNGLLPAGIIITGGGSSISTIEDLAKAALKLPSKKAQVKFEGNIKGQFRDSEWVVAYGLCVFGLSGEEDGSTKLGLRFTGKAPRNIWDWVKQFLP